MLVEFTREMPDYATEIEFCRRTGIETAGRLTKELESQGLLARLKPTDNSPPEPPPRAKVHRPTFGP
jgi:hypothetical protein